MRQVDWRKLFLKGTIWLIAEIVLSMQGIDDLADYSEFITDILYPSTPTETAIAWTSI